MNFSIKRIIANNRVSSGVMACALALLVTACSPSGDAPAANPATDARGGAAGSASADSAVTHATNFHLLDFVAWNNHDLDMFRRLHTADVKVEMGGARTEGIDAHVQALQPMWKPDFQVMNHAPIVAEGEWTCVVGTSAPPSNMKMVTVAKWRDGAIAEEYISMNLLKPGMAKPAVSGSPMVSISNRNAELKALVGAEAGWSCRLERTSEGKMVFSLTKTGGAAAEEMVFTQ